MDAGIGNNNGKRNVISLLHVMPVPGEGQSWRLRRPLALA